MQKTIMAGFIAVLLLVMPFASAAQPPECGSDNADFIAVAGPALIGVLLTGVYVAGDIAYTKVVIPWGTPEPHGLSDCVEHCEGIYGLSVNCEARCKRMPAFNPNLQNTVNAAC